MRPAVPDVLPPRSRKPSVAEQVVPSWSDPRSAAPATFFIARDADLGDSRSGDADSPKDSMYGVQSLEETIDNAGLDASDRDGHDDDDLPSTERRSTIKPLDLHDERPPSSHISLSRPITPLGLASSDGPSSLPSSPKSITNQSLKPLDDISITDEIASQALAEEDDEPVAAADVHDGTSQLIMPSIKMPSRRPFTEKGKAMGRFKILVAGAPGSGKTSLVKSIVQACEDIVHVDPLPQHYPSGASSKSRSRAGSKSARGTTAISEIYASTKPYPSWWSDLEDSRVLRRRKGVGEVVLERNLCFVDTPGGTMSRASQTEAIAQYINQQLLRAVAAMNTGNVDLQNMLGGNGGSQVDAVLYLISEDTLTTDIDCIRKLCELSNVIPVISKADLLSSSQIISLKKSFHEEAQKAGVKPFLFGDPPPEPQDGEDAPAPQSPFAVSSAKSSDDDTMDASVLMSPDYELPLVSSELGLLIEKMFDLENLAWLRHSAAKKLAQKRDTLQHPPQFSLPRFNIPGFSSPLPSMSPPPQVLGSYPGDGSSSYTMARVADYTQREERLAQVRLAKWASDLQRSLQNERERYAALARGERAVWLTERLSECVIDGTLIPITQTPGFSGLNSPPQDKERGGVLVRTRNGHKVEYVRIPSSLMSPHDPLGLLRWNDDLKRRGWIVIQVLGSFGVVGGLALWLAKVWGLPPSQSLTEWHFSYWFGGD